MKRCAVLLCLPLCFAPPAEPLCSAPLPRLVCAEYYAATIVVEARLVRKTPNRDKDIPTGILSWDYQMSTELTLRGSIGKSFQIHEENDSGRAGFYWVRGRSYLLFLTYNPQSKAWVLDGCGNSGPLNKAGTALAQIQKLKSHPHRGRLEGQVSVNTLSGGFPNVRVEARGSTGIFIAHTNDDGNFRLQLPIGHYELHAMSEGLSFNDYDFSYERSSGLDIAPGGCAQVQIVESTGKWPKTDESH
jgi:hypothetical protein